MLAAWPATRELHADEPAPRTSLDHLIGPDRNLVVIRSSIDLATEVAHAYDATVNDVLPAVTAGGLRKLLCSRGERVEGLIVLVHVPVTLRERGAAR